MKVLYTGDNETTNMWDLDALISEFDAHDGWKHRHNAADMRDELESRGWYEGMHEHGRYLVLNMEKLGLAKTD